ncbi:MAG TPA: CHASE3 domain-containing protein [Acetobacteraceae bacterium]|nr:CHASE3 domain-containing protein [Acetobacteraceae bacterium]
MTEPGPAPPDTTDAPLHGYPRGVLPTGMCGAWQRRVWVLQACGFALLVAALATIVGMALRSSEADAWVAHTLETRHASGALFSVVQDAEASVRAFLLTRNPGELARYDVARDALPAAQAQLRVLTLDDPAQTARLDALAPLIAQRIAALVVAVAIARSGDEQTLAERMRRRAGGILMDKIRARLAAFDQAEADLLNKRETAARDARRQLLLGSSGALSLALLLGSLTTVLSHRQARALRDANAQLAGTVSDRTGALRDSERRFHQVFHDSPIGLTISTAETRRIIAANPAFCRMFGYTEAELFGRISRDFAHPDDFSVAVPLADGPQPDWRPAEKRYITKSGAVLFARSSIVPLVLPRERDPLILGTTEDVTREKQIEAALRDSEQRMRLAVAAAGLGVYEQDALRRVVRFDARAAAITGGTMPANVWLDFDGPELAAWNALIHPDDAAGRAAAERALLDGSRDMATEEYRVRTADGGWTWLSAFGTIAERDPSANRVLRVLTVIQDITRRKDTELELRHAQRMEAIGQLTGGVAHDFNNLLGAILGHAEFLIDRLAERTEERELATEILDCALNGAALTQRLLAFARRQPLQPAVIDLNEYLPVHVSLLQRTLGEIVTVEVALGPELWLTLADPSQIVDVLLNLAINARDAMPHGGTLTIETANAVLDAAYCARHHEAIPGEYVVLSVADTGTGMPPEVLARAMEPFFTTKPPGKGSGLGLSTIYGFARQSGGYLSIDSAPGKGTTVRLYLPHARGERTSDAAAKIRTQPPPRGNETILVVDDNDGMRATAARNLAALGYRVRLAADGPAALAILQAGEHCDLLFTDLVMPNGLSGYQVADAAKALQPGLPVLFTTGFAAEDDAETAMMDPNVLRKPYRRRELAERVRAVLDG